VYFKVLMVIQKKWGPEYRDQSLESLREYYTAIKDLVGDYTFPPQINRNPIIGRIKTGNLSEKI